MSTTPDDLLRRLRSNNVDTQTLAIRELTAILLQHAHANFPQRNHVNFQSESLVQSAITTEYAFLFHSPYVTNDDHLLGRMRRAVENKGIDRARSKKNKQVGIGSGEDVDDSDDSRESLAPATNGRSPATWTNTAISQASLNHHEQRGEECRARLLAGLRKQDQDIVQLAVIDDKEWRSQDIATHLGLKSGEVVRKRMQNLRPELRRRLLAPVIEKSEQRDRDYIQGLLVDRIEAIALVASKGSDPKSPPNPSKGQRGTNEANDAVTLMRWLTNFIHHQPQFYDCLGAEGTRYLLRLMGTIRKNAKPNAAET